MGCCDGTLVLLCMIVICTNSVYALASLFLPVVFREREVAGFWVGLVFSMYSIAGILISPVIGKIIHKIGSSNFIAFGLTLMGLAIIPISSLTKIENDSGAVAFALLLRAMQGTASASINTTNYGMAATKYADKTVFVMGLLESSCGVGLVLGLIGGSVVYETMGYEAVFFTFGGLLLFMAILSRLLFCCLEQSEVVAAAEDVRQNLLESDDGTVSQR